MTERGMIFNGEMVRALLDGRKTQTRRPIKWKHTRFTEIGEREDGSKWPWSEDAEHACDFWHPCPFGAVGDRIWVRETFCPVDDTQYGGEKWVDYRATPKFEASHPAGWDSAPNDAEALKWRPSIHMPRWASRILLEITDVRVERLNAISQADAIAEGAPPSHPSIDCVSQEYGFPDFSRSWFGQTWQHIYGSDSWNANPWVWVIEFKRVEGGAA
ncbi:hypothetical protein CWN40_04545 [Klebsiella quasipneumoniae]|uniref:hypothetical protein n=1 Tax=Klebsiella quasipneumoniae TaxID=1463165 RepID=UPI000C7E6001|nr:hypothetical protein [Klebsiella quasipneumoniae]PLK61925.1 hypothetical protein CWN69_06730 [Klebsiella quasipneumoniae]PLM38984.1 hypothetical protein CWN40_04545 [Klebsiella quasipneumoniae]